jgi:hypothetical protein
MLGLRPTARTAPYRWSALASDPRRPCLPKMRRARRPSMGPRRRKADRHEGRIQSPPIHWNDRCVLSPIPKSFRDIGLNIDEPTDEGQRASSLGPVAGGTTFEQFFGSCLRAAAALFRAAQQGWPRIDAVDDGPFTDGICARGAMFGRQDHESSDAPWWRPNERPGQRYHPHNRRLTKERRHAIRCQ